ncbi:MAG: PIG-L family deacetylase [Saprospiraceae bacterium]|nr:PIG-L family deacetylase [Saprospiraceae bacterium]
MKNIQGNQYVHFLLPLFCLWLGSCTEQVSTDEASSVTSEVETTPVDPKGKVLMAIFSHPDDESTVAPILSKYVREGARVVLVIATDGRLGTNDFSGLEAGDGLVEIRKEELKCSAEKLGVELIQLDYHDQLKAAEGYDGHIPHVRALIKEVHQLVTDIQPDVLITWGPDGGSNHMDHRLVGATVTNVFLSKIWDKPTALFYYGAPSNLIDNEESKILRGVDPKYLMTQIPYEDSDFEAAVVSLACHKSQFQMENLRERMEQRYRSRKVYLRKFVAPTTLSESLFD